MLGTLFAAYASLRDISEIMLKQGFVIQKYIRGELTVLLQKSLKIIPRLFIMHAIVPYTFNF